MLHNGFAAVACPKHPQQGARKPREHPESKKGEMTQKHFTGASGLKSYRLARRLLDGLRFKILGGAFDRRDYEADNPLAYRTFLQGWLFRKERKPTLQTFRPLKLDTHKYAASVCEALEPRDLGVTKFFMKHGLRDKSGRKLGASGSLHLRSSSD